MASPNVNLIPPVGCVALGPNLPQINSEGVENNVLNPTAVIPTPNVGIKDAFCGVMTCGYTLPQITQQITNPSLGRILIITLPPIYKELSTRSWQVYPQVVE